MICLTLTAPTLQGWSDTLGAYGTYADLLELRLDLLERAQCHPDRVVTWAAAQTTAYDAILTCRRAADYGAWGDGEDRRCALLFAILTSLTHAEHAVRVRYIDLELDRVGRADWTRLADAARAHGVRVIRSEHLAGLDRAPGGDAGGVLTALAHDRREIPKLAVAVSSLEEHCRLLERVDAAAGVLGARPRIVIAMGAYGTPSRLLPERYGSMWSYSSAIDVAAAAAPGHVGPEALARTYGLGGEHRAKPTVFAVVGFPIAHSKSPEYHNARLRAARWSESARYVPVCARGFAEFLQYADLVDIQGASVTVPHKQAALAAAASASAIARRAGAANTLVRRPGGGWHADNTDAEAAIRPLLDARVDLSGPVALIGAGGAARAIAVALQARRSEVWLFNRSPERLDETAHALGVPPERTGLLENGDGLNVAAATFGREPAWSVVVQTTDVGMAPDTDRDPAPRFDPHTAAVVYDLIYTPAETRFLARARGAGCTVLNGAVMFREQAAAQFVAFEARLSAVATLPHAPA